MKIQEIPGKIEEIPTLEIVKVTTAGNTVKIQSVSRKNKKATTLKLSADEYMNLRTGEIITVEHSDNRSENTKSLLKSLARLRDIINTNVTEPSHLRWITLTYAENMTDVHRLYDDMRNYHARFKRYCLKHGYKIPEYIDVPEPQERGAWHTHEILIWNDIAPFIPTCDLEKVWGNGFVKIKALDDNIDNIGAYLTPYLTDLELDPTMPKTDVFRKDDIIEREIDLDGKKVRKKFIKGGRLTLYPPGMNLYRNSRGIKEPVIEKMTYFEAKEKVLGATKTFEKSVLLTDDTFRSVISTEYYNTKRK